MESLPTSGSPALDAMADAIASRVIALLMAEQKSALMTIAETAKYLGRGPGGIRGLIAKGILPSSKMGGRVMVRRVDADALIQQSVNR